MNSLWLTYFIIIIVVILTIISTKKRRMELMDMIELLNSYIGRNCRFNFNYGFGSIKGELIRLNGNAVEIIVKNKVTKIINLESISSVDILE